MVDKNVHAFNFATFFFSFIMGLSRDYYYYYSIVIISICTWFFYINDKNKKLFIK